MLLCWLSKWIPLPNSCLQWEVQRWDCKCCFWIKSNSTANSSAPPLRNICSRSYCSSEFHQSTLPTLGVCLPVRVDDPDHKDNFCTDVQSLNIYLSIKKGIAYICVKKSKSVVLNILAQTACLIISSLNSWVTSMLGKQLNKMCTVDMVMTKDTWVQRLLTRDLYKIQKLLF